MSFLFKSKRTQDRSLASRDGTSGSQSSLQGVVKGSGPARATPTGSLNSLDNDGIPASPERANLRRGASLDQSQPSDLPLRNGPQPANTGSSLYPWSQRRVNYTSSHPPPFPRYGAAVNSVSSKEGDIYLMGGLINSSTVKGDLWMIEAGGNMACYPLATTSEGPGPRVGHSSLLVGNAFIVYGGDTKIDESDVLDETLYLLNTSTRQWSRALPSGPRPAGRYGHSLNIIGSKIYIFGGQVEDNFMNDLSAFDLNQLQMPNNRWEILLQGDTSPKTPVGRTNHSMVTFNDKMYLFGGTNGFQWFNDVWCYDSTTNKWSQFDCIGYIPAPREGHAAALVDDVMYIFGGRTEEGTDLGDLAAFRISSRRWYTFQNMGPSPSPRSGHSMTTVGKSIFTVGGEPSSAATAVNDLGALYILDTTKIRYPADQQGQQGQQGMQRLPQGQRRPSLTDGPNPSRAGPSREGSTGPDQRKLMGPPVSQTNGVRSPPNAIDMQGLSGAPGSKLPRVAQSATGPPPQGPPLGPPPSRPIVDTGSIGRIRAGSVDPAVTSNSPLSSSNEQGSPATQVMGETNIVSANGRRTPTQQPQPRSSSKQENPGWEGTKGHVVKQPSGGSVDNGTVEAGPKLVAPPPSSPPPPSRQLSNHLSRRSSGRNSQTVVLLKELDSARNRNAWYASELELARKAGYVSTAASSQVLDGRGTETFDDEDRPLVEALLAMRTELATVQSAVDERAAIASKQVAEALKQRDAAVQEALYAKAKLAAHTSGSQADVARLDSDRGDFASRSEDMGKKLSTALHIQKDFQTRLDTARAELEVERKARQLADDSARSTSTRLSELESFKQKTSAELERLKAELHLAQRDAREHSVAFADAAASLEILKAEKAELSSQYEGLIGSSKEHSDTFESLRAVIAASEGSKAHLQSKLEEERSQREIVQEKLTNLKAEHEARTAELVATTQRLRDAEELAEKHANEATTHRHALLNGLDKLALRDNEKEKKPDDERLVALQNQVSASNALVKKYQQEADAAADRLRSAEERIAGLEQYQEQSSREGVGIRRQLQSALRETHALHTANAELKGKLAAQQLETNATTVQHNALKDILAERGISPTGAVRSRGLASPRTNTPDQSRIRDLEVQLATAATAHEETKLNFAVQAQESESMYREKLAQLESDYQSAVHYVKGTEKMLKQLKEQLNRHKAENTQLNSEIERLEDQLRKDSQNSAASAEWVAERNSLHKQIEGLEIELRGSSAEFQRQLEAVRTQVAESQRQRDEAIRHGQDTAQKLNAQAKSFDQLRSDAALLEQRAVEAEQKVSLLLDQVEHSVDTYRRQSRQEMGAVANGTNLGHTRNESSEVESIYEENHADARNSTALDNLASELETLRSHWEATNKNYRLSNNFDMETTSPSKRDDDAGLGLSESLADWRKKLDTEERTGGVEKARQV